MPHLKRDMIGGLTVALVLIPQSMAYAQLAGLPAFYGLYAALIPPIVAALFGSSRQLATGPVAVVSLMTAVALEPLAATGGHGYVIYAVVLAFMVGMFQFALGVLRLGLLVNFLSHPVVNGFTNGAAFIIATSQLPKMFGVYVDKGDVHLEMIARVFRTAADYTHWPTLMLGVLAFIIMVVLKRISPRIPNILVAVVITTAISAASGYEHSRTVRLDAIASVEARESIGMFNGLVAEMEKKAADRSAFRNRYLRARAEGEKIAAVNARGEVEIADMEIQDILRQLALLRQSIRSMRFEGVVQLAERLTLHAKGGVLAGGPGDGRTWRIRVDDRRIDPAQVPVFAGGDIVGSVPRGLPALTLPTAEMGVIRHLAPYAVIIALLGFMETISIAKAMAAKTGQRIDPNQELIGQGLGNMCGALAGSYPTAGSFSRSAVNLQSGAVSGLSSVFTGLTVVVTLMMFTPLLYYLPQSALAAIIMMAVMGLINIRGIVHAWRAQWYDGMIAVITFGCTLGFAPHLDRGILVGVALSIAIFLYKSMRPAVVDLSLGLDWTLHDAVTSGLRECRYIDVVRFDGPLFFANASYLEERIRERRVAKKELKHIIIVANGINDIDASGEEALSLLVDRIRSARMGISLSGVNETVLAVITRTHLIAKIGRENLFPDFNAAIAAVHEATHRGGTEKDCPLTSVVASHGLVIKKGEK